ncbi:hypothetical protein P175DRAFT_0496831, partial [Aspergillus ochraceoroseus IBT 24754]
MATPVLVDRCLLWISTGYCCHSSLSTVILLWMVASPARESALPTHKRNAVKEGSNCV